MATASNAAAAANPEAQRFWGAVADWPEQAQRAFWEGSARLSEFIGENPNPQVLQFDRSKPPPDMPWWEKALFYYGQSHVNQAAVAQAQARATVQGATWLWGTLQGDFNRSPTTGQIVTGGVLSMIPVVDQLCDVRDVVANCLALSDEEGRRDDSNWFALGLTCFGFIPELGSAVKTVAKVAIHKGVRLIDIVKRMEWLESLGGKVRLPWGRAPLRWLQAYDWVAAAKTAGAAAKRAFENALRKVEAAIRWATGAIKTRLQQLAGAFKAIIARVEQAIEDVALKVRDSIRNLLRRDKREIGRFDAAPGSAPNRHVQRENEPSGDARSGSQSATSKIAERKRIADGFYRRQGFDPDEIPAHTAGIDFEKPVEVITLKKGTVVEQWQAPGGGQGNYYAVPPSRPTQLGIAPQAAQRQTGVLVDRVPTRYVLAEDVEVLRSTAAPIGDTWSVPGKTIATKGGGTQMFTAAKHAFRRN